MLKTKGFHYDLLYTALEGEVFQAKLRNQLRFLKVREEEHTGTGLFVYFKEIAGMSKFKLSKQLCFSQTFDNHPNIILFEFTSCTLV